MKLLLVALKQFVLNLRESHHTLSKGCFEENDQCLFRDNDLTARCKKDALKLFVLIKQDSAWLTLQYCRLLAKR